MKEEELVEIMTAPVYRKNALQITIKRIFTDVNGTIVDKATVPAALQVQYPVYLFSEFDRNGAYYNSLRNKPCEVGTFYLCSFVYGIQNPMFFGFSGLQNIQGALNVGDLVTVFTDSILVPTYYIWIVQQSPNRPLAAILSNLPDLPPDPEHGYLRIEDFDFYTDNFSQWQEDIQWIKYDYLGLVKTNNLQPGTYLTPNIPQNGFIRVELRTTLTQYMGLNFYMLFDTDSITMTFQLKIKK